jgi:hypothetical protein
VDVRIKPLESDLQAALVEAIRLLGKRAGVNVCAIPNQRKPPAKPGSAHYIAWCAKLEAQGYEWGAPDLLVYWPGPGGVRYRGADEVFVFGPCRALWIECKRPGEKRRKAQDDWHERAHRAGIAALTWDDGRVETALTWLRARGCPI